MMQLLPRHDVHTLRHALNVLRALSCTRDPILGVPTKKETHGRESFLGNPNKLEPPNDLARRFLALSILLLRILV